MQRQMPDVVVSLEATDQVQAYILLHQPKRTDDMLLVRAALVGDPELFAVVERVGGGFKDPGENLWRNERHVVGQDSDLLEPFTLPARGRRIKKILAGKIKERSERSQEICRELVPELVSGHLQQQALGRGEVPGHHGAGSQPVAVGL